MSQAPVLPMFVDAMIGDTLHLTAEEFGAYHLILYAIWRNNGEPLADDDARLARIARVSVARWRTKIRPALVAFFDLSARNWRQKRLEKEFNYSSKRAAIARLNGTTGGRPKALKDNDTENPAGSGRVTQTESSLTQKKERTPLSPMGTSPQGDALTQDDVSGSPDFLKSVGEVTPAAPLSATGAPDERTKAQRGSRLAPDWQPDSGDRVFASGLGLDPDAVAGTFRDYWHAKPGAGGRKLDWPATWRNWCRHDAERRGNGADRAGGGGQRAGSYLEAGARVLARLERDGAL